jgi:hypothetical protein
MPATGPFNFPLDDATRGPAVRLADGDLWVFPAVTAFPCPDAVSGWWSSLGDEHARLIGRYAETTGDACTNRENIEADVELAGMTLMRNYALSHRHAVWLVWGGVVDDDRRARLLGRSVRASLGCRPTRGMRRCRASTSPKG